MSSQEQSVQILNIRRFSCATRGTGSRAKGQCQTSEQALPLETPRNQSDVSRSILYSPPLGKGRGKALFLQEPKTQNV